MAGLDQALSVGPVAQAANAPTPARRQDTGLRNLPYTITHRTRPGANSSPSLPS